MSTLAQEFAKADRLSAITQRVGFALWQLQDLESVAAGYFVLLVQAERGMSLSAGEALVEKAQSKTFGATVHQIAKAGLLSTEIEARFKKILSERNWLVHHSRSDSRNAIHSERAMNNLLERLDAIARESLSLLKVIDADTTTFVKSHGVSMDYVEHSSKLLLEAWQTTDAS